MKTAFGLLLGAAYAVFLIWGFVRFENVTENALGDLGVPPGTSKPCALGAGPWRPEGGIVDGQGCWGGGEDGNEHGSGCGYSSLPGATYGFRMPYFQFTPFTRRGEAYGGQIIFEWRVHNQIILPLLFAWSFFLFILIGFAHLPWPGFQRWRRKKFLTCPCPFQPRKGLFNPEEWFGWLWELNRGQTVMSFWVLVEVFLYGCYCYEHARLNNLVGPLSRGFGGIAVGSFPLLLFPALRHSPLVPYFGMSFDRSVAFHRRIGVIIFTCVTVHWVLMGFAHARVYNRGQPPPDYDFCNETAPREYVDAMSWGDALGKGFGRLVLWDIGFPHGPPLAGTISWGCMLLMVISANFFRRDRWECFLAIHMLYVVVYVMVWIHYPTTLILCLPMMCFFVFDMIFRRWRMRKPYKARLTYFPDAQVTQVLIRVEGAKWRPWPGSWVTIHLPDAELNQGTRFFRLEHHPFSVSSVKELYDDSFEMTVHCKVMGDQVWTSRLASLADTGALSGFGEEERGLNDYPVYMDGPFGNLSPPLKKQNEVFLIGGGIGVTPLINTLEMGRNILPEFSQMTLIWSIPSHAMIAPFKKQLERIVKNPSKRCQVSILIYVTRKPKGMDDERTGLLSGMASSLSQQHSMHIMGQIQGEGKEGEGIHLEVGRRPDFEDLLPDYSEGVVVYVCGPTPMVSGVSRLCVKREIEFHCESFLF